jgi:hypothetical protein
LDYLKRQKLLVKPWPPIWQNCLIDMDWKKKYCICERWRVKFNYNDNCL